MTIGIAAFGANAGLGIFKALEAVEKVARGAIGGFVSMAVITGDGQLLRAETQRGGTRTLFTQGEVTGTLPTPAFATASMAVLMSSGPDRPAPLSQFTPGDAVVGLVSGHRLPNMPGDHGIAPNLAVLAQMRDGSSARSAIEAVLRNNPHADAGLIALDQHGELYLGNSDLIAARGDLGQAFEDAPHGRVGVLHNAIHPHQGLAPLAVATALDAMSPPDRIDLEITFDADVPLLIADHNAALIDDAGRITAIHVRQEAWMGEYFEGAALNFQAAICRDGDVIGHAVTEPYCVARNRHVISMSGRGHARIGVRLFR